MNQKNFEYLRDQVKFSGFGETLESLQKGNRQSVTFLQSGSEQKHFIEANPRFKSVNLYDSNMQRLGSKQSKGEKQVRGGSNTAKQEVKKESQKQSQPVDSDDIPKESKKRTKRQSQSMS
ncbi:hypothetical protein BH24BAC1_BH24BAC1_22340 [soil metagenome]